jgi:hypothetical protein
MLWDLKQPDSDKNQRGGILLPIHGINCLDDSFFKFADRCRYLKNRVPNSGKILMNCLKRMVTLLKQPLILGLLFILELRYRPTEDRMNKALIGRTWAPFQSSCQRSGHLMR